MYKAPKMKDTGWCNNQEWRPMAVEYSQMSSSAVDIAAVAVAVAEPEPEPADGVGVGAGVEVQTEPMAQRNYLRAPEHDGDSSEWRL